MRFRRSCGLRLPSILAVGLATAVASIQAQKPPALASVITLQETSWQLVRFRSGDDDRTLAPGDRAKYTIRFAKDGEVALRLDCNRGTSTWKSSAPGRLQFGPLATTRALCPPGSHFDRLVQDLEHVSSFALEGGRLCLSLTEEGGTYEFERLPTEAP
jgi:para-nitrobenzyl esterase